MNIGINLANDWWRARSARERGLVSVLAVLALGLVAWYGVALPLRETARQAEMNRARMADLLREVESARAAIGAIVVPSDAELSDILTLSATEAGFALESQRDANTGEIVVSGHAPDSAVLFGWLEMLRTNHGLVVANLSVSRGEDGALRVEALLARGGA